MVLVPMVHTSYECDRDAAAVTQGGVSFLHLHRLSSWMHTR